jgi:6-phosphogluconate dehydrogenase
MTGTCEIGVIGLGVMGLNLCLNLVDHGFKVAGYDRTKQKVDAIQGRFSGAYSLQEFVGLLKPPRVVLLLVPAGPATDAAINEVTPFFERGDYLLDGGNSYYKDTDIRAKKLAKKGIHFYGMGVSGGEEGARKGPSLMPGGPKEEYNHISPFLEAIAAKVDGRPCVAYLGPGSAGHFVKMVHNGIEYGIMQLISETYDLMKRGLNIDNDQLSEIYNEWNQGDLASYLLEITSAIFKKNDPKTGKKLVEVILDVAGQKGTGMWTTQSAMQLQIPTPSIDAAVSMRDLTTHEQIRRQASQILKRDLKPYQGSKDLFLNKLKEAFYVGTLVVYAQGLALLMGASEKLHYSLDLAVITTIWRGGCIIRAAVLEKMREAYEANRSLPHLLLDPTVAKIFLAKEESLRGLLCTALDIGIPLPGLSSTLAYFDSIRSAWLPANLIQAQRDYFGSHTYGRNDEKGTFHTEWEPI